MKNVQGIKLHGPTTQGHGTHKKKIIQPKKKNEKTSSRICIKICLWHPNQIAMLVQLGIQRKHGIDASK